MVAHVRNYYVKQLWVDHVTTEILAQHCLNGVDSGFHHSQEPGCTALQLSQAIH